MPGNKSDSHGGVNVYVLYIYYSILREASHDHDATLTHEVRGARGACARAYMYVHVHVHAHMRAMTRCV